MSTQTLLALVIRHILTILAGSLGWSGWLTGDAIQQLAAAIVGVLAVGWSIYNKKAPPTASDRLKKHIKRSRKGLVK